MSVKLGGGKQWDDNMPKGLENASEVLKGLTVLTVCLNGGRKGAGALEESLTASQIHRGESVPGDRRWSSGSDNQETWPRALGSGLWP